MPPPTTPTAPDLQLEFADGPARQLSDLWRGRTLLIWFSRGLACPFCRRQSAQFAKIQAELDRLGTTALQIAPTSVEAARTVQRYFPIAWHLACDPDGEAARAFGLGEEADKPAAGAGPSPLAGMREQARALGILLSHPAEPHPEALPAIKALGPPPTRTGGAVLVADGGEIAYRHVSGPLSLLPPLDGLLDTVRKVSGQGTPA